MQYKRDNTKPNFFKFEVQKLNGEFNKEII